MSKTAEIEWLEEALNTRPWDVTYVAGVKALFDERRTLRTAVEEMLAEAKQTNYDRAGKSEFDEGREVAYQYVLDLMDGGRS